MPREGGKTSLLTQELNNIKRQLKSGKTRSKNLRDLNAEEIAALSDVLYGSPAAAPDKAAGNPAAAPAGSVEQPPPLARAEAKRGRKRPSSEKGQAPR